MRGERGCFPERWKSPQDGSTALHLAVTEGYAVVVEMLCGAGGADPDVKDAVTWGGGSGMGIGKGNRGSNSV